MKKIFSVFHAVALAVLSLFFVSTAHATNGMNLEGYGPIATGMGGASMAYDNGTAAMMNNPATLGLMPEGDRLDAALGYLGPHVTSKTAGAADSKSSADAFFMPAFGIVKKSGSLAYGAGVFSQGGMGAEYDATSFLTMGSGEKVRSELGVGRVLIPVAYNVNKDFIIGGSLDFVWASLDLKMALSGAQFADLVGPSIGGSNTYGTASGSMVNTLVGAFTVPQVACGNAPCLAGLNWARFDFSDDSAFSGKAKATGYGAKIGGVYKVSDTLTLGAAYHSKTNLGDLEANGATLSMNVVGPATGGAPVTIPVNGKIKIVDFQWPQMLGAGAAYQASEKLLLVFDYKWINWKDVMKDFKMSFTADANQLSPAAGSGPGGFGLGGQFMNATLRQNWKDQNVFMLGAGYKVSPDWTVRAGLSIANNPIPDMFLLPLFPAIEKNHVMVGAGYMISKASSVDASFTYAPEVKATTTLLTNTGPVPVTVTHSQTNAQLMYSYRF
jgi:long-chain fatty acid transport protein